MLRRSDGDDQEREAPPRHPFLAGGGETPRKAVVVATTTNDYDLLSTFLEEPLISPQDWEGDAPASAVNPGRGPDYPSMQCTDHAARRWTEMHKGTKWENALFFSREPNNRVRHAKVHPDLAREIGLRVDHTPRIGSEVVFTGGVFEKYGHVAIVEKIEGDRIYVSQSNYPQPLTYSEQWYEIGEAAWFISPPEETPTTVTTAHAELSAYLASKGSPYANVDITAHCDSAGITRDQCRLLIAICGKESKHGTMYKNSKGHAASEGQEFHNCGGVKRGSWNAQYPYTPSTGWWLVQFPDWDTFFAEFAKGMKRGWFDKGASTPGELCFQYVGNPHVCESSWLNGVNFFLSEIPQLT